MNAVVFADNKIDVVDVPRPRLEEPRDALVRVNKTAICGSDLHVLDGKTPGMRNGGVMGHEFVGIVEEAGPEAQAHPTGTRVLGSFLIACGRCPACRSRRFNRCARRRALGLGELTGGLDGAQAEFVRIPDADVNLRALDGPRAALDDEAALFCGDILATGLYAAYIAAAAPGERVVVIGAGPVGLFSAGAARRAGADVVVLDTDSERVAFARRAYDFDARDATSEDISSLEADAAIDAAGTIPAFKSALRAVRDGGRVAIVGVYGKERYDLPMGMVWARALDLRFAGMANVQAHWDDALDAVADNDIDPRRMITHRLPLERAAEGYELFRSRRALKVVLEP